MNAPVYPILPPPRAWGLWLPARGYGRCAWCRRPWWARREHEVWISDRTAVFALCRGCWPRLSTVERLTAHRWAAEHYWSAQDDWPLIEAAILSPDGDNPWG